MEKLIEWKLRVPWEDEECLFRINPSDYVEVEGHSKYEGSNIHKILRKIERRIEDKWEPYPSVVWVDNGNIDSEYGLYSAWFAVDKEGAVVLVNGPYGIPDGTLMINAEKKGILTKTFDL